MSLSGNKGEWSEIYAFFKILGDGVMYAGDPDLNKLEEIFYPIIKILRKEKGNDVSYEINGNIIFISGKDKLEIPKSLFIEKARYLFDTIKNTKNKASFEIPEMESFLNEIECLELKANKNQKSDINIVIHDHRTGLKPLLGFSIKSKIGSDSTIVNSSQLSNFVYELDNISAELIDDINNLNKTRSTKKGLRVSPNIRLRVKTLINNNVSVNFSRVQGEVYESNMILISDNLPKILARMLIIYYSTGTRNCEEICNILHDDNPLEYDKLHGHKFYHYKAKKFLLESALGMVAKNVWNGYHDATGGYIVVKEDGEVLCYHLYNRNDFEDYLLKNTKFDTPSTGRNKFSDIYIENGKPYIKLNILIKYS